MKNASFFRQYLLLLCVVSVCVITAFAFAGCARDEGGYILASADAKPRGDAVEEITATERSHIEVTVATTTAATEPPEVVATGTSAATSVTEPPVTEPPKEYYTVKFVDSDGYTPISVQTVIEGGDAVEPAMPEKKGELLFRGWSRDFTNVQKSMVVSAIYEKEIFTVNFYDIDGTLLKTEQVHWGEDATAPDVADRENYLFDGWNVLFNNVRADLDVYATYYAEPQRDKLSLVRAYEILPHEDNVLDLPSETYYRRTHNAMFTVGQSEYSGDHVLYGNFCDTFSIGGFGFDGFEGRLCLTGNKDAFSESSFSLRLTLLCDGKQVYNEKLTLVGSSSRFDIDLTNVKELTVILEPMLGEYVYYDEATFIGGILDGAFYKE